MRNPQFSIAALIALSAATGGAFAGTPASWGQGSGAEASAFVSTASSATVQANAAKSLGQIRHGQAGGTEQTAFVSVRTRDEVKAETAQALRQGEILNGLGAGSRTAQSVSTTNVAGRGAASTAM